MQDEDRRRFCEKLAVLTFDPANTRKCVLADQLRDEVLRYYSDAKSASLTEASSRFEKFALDARLSMFLVRDDPTGSFRFAHRAMETFFLSQVIAQELWDPDKGLITLARAPITREHSLLPVFVFAELGHRLRDAELRASFTAEHGRRTASDAVGETLDRFRGTESASAVVKYGPHLVSNLVRLKIAMDQCAGHAASCCLSGLALTFACFDDVPWPIPNETGGVRPKLVIDVANANVEFA